MIRLPEALRTIEASPEGPAVGAFFDLDGTLVQGFTALHVLRHELPTVGARALVRLARDVMALRNDEERDLHTIERAIGLFEGRSIEELTKLSRQVFRERVAVTLRPGARELIRAHARQGHTVVMATAATRFQAEPVARDLGIPHLLATEVEVVDGQMTGKVLGRPRWGAEKAKAVVAFAGEHDIDLSSSFAYGNGREDRAFLEAVGNPVAVCPDRELEEVATLLGAPVLQLDDPPAASWRTVLGTVASMGTFNAGLTAVLAGRLISGGRWKAIGPTLASAAEVALSMAGIEVRVQGREYLEAARPAVFVVNHQSNLDPVVAGSLIRHDFTVVGKREVASDPRSFAMRFLDIALIDRSDPKAARESLAALVERIQGGESVAIWPEGTRMPTQRLGPFKKGAFHLAMDAGVPIVPIVLRNTGELWPRGHSTLRPGVVDVCVLEPVPTAGWRREELRERVAEIRARFEATLERWPEGEAS